MEENITIVKSLIEDLEREEKLIGYNAEIEIQALENFIKEYKDSEDILKNITKENLEYKQYIRRLEEKLKRYEKYLENKDKRFNEALENEYQERKTDYIPKSKVKEKIEELKKEYEIALEENSTKAFILKCQIDILEKLMEDK